LNEAACGGGRFAWARSKIFLSQRKGSSIGIVLIDERTFARFGSTQDGDHTSARVTTITVNIAISRE
jgi:hypothetical protein